jgi:hypothetical protein
MEAKGHESLALAFKFNERNYTLELHPLALKVDGQLVERVDDGSGRRLQESQLKVLRYLLQHNYQYCSIDTIAASANLRAKNPGNAIRAHIYYLRAVVGDSGRPPQLIKTREARQHDGADTTYGIFAEVKAVDCSVFEELKEIKPTGDEKGTSPRVELAAPMAALRHLFGPVLVIAPLSAMLILGIWFVLGKPNHPADRILAVQAGPPSESKQELEALLDSHIRDYKANLTRFNSDCALQALLLILAILLICRRSDSLKAFDYSIRLSWLYLCIPVLMVYFWLDFGFVLDGLIWGRLRGVELIKALNYPNMEYQRTVFLDWRFVDGWFLTFIDGHRGETYSGISRGFSASTAALFALVLGTLISAAHASVLAIPPIALRRYLQKKSDRWLIWYYLSPILPLMILLSSHVQFAYGGENRNWLQLYIAVVTIPLMALLMWLSAVVDRTSYPDSVGCLRRRHQVIYKERSIIDLDERTISLIGDRLSTSFHLSSSLAMLFLSWVAWKRNWFVKLDCANADDASLLKRVSIDFGPVRGFQHASVFARVDDGGRRGVIDRLKDTWHFSHQVDEVLAGRFPDMLLIWIGHNDLDLKSKTSSSAGPSLDALSEEFIGRYTVQLQRLIRAALAGKRPCAIIVFGLISFESLFKAREDAERKRQKGRSFYPYVETCYRYSPSVIPEHRERTMELSKVCNRKLASLCRQLGERLSERGVRLTYSDAMAKANMDDVDLLSAADAWHPSLSGQSLLAKGAYQSVRDQADFLGWRP